MILSDQQEIKIIKFLNSYTLRPSTYSISIDNYRDNFSIIFEH